MGGGHGVITEDDLVVGTSYTMIIPKDKYGNNPIKMFLGRYDGIVYNLPNTNGKPSNFHSFPERAGDASKYFRVGHFNQYNIIFEVGNTEPKLGGRRRKANTRKTRRSRRSTRRQ